MVIQAMKLKIGPLTCGPINCLSLMSFSMTTKISGRSSVFKACEAIRSGIIGIRGKKISNVLTKMQNPMMQ